ncbi:MAG: LytR family transcriptional regulator [Anaerolineales bacterium]|nr:MAG: LytR family transcriptional regulator [Anaerolineales bacterium]
MNPGSKRTARRRSSFPHWLIKALAGAFIIAALLSGYLVYVVVHGLAAAWTGTGLPSFNIFGGQSSITALDPEATPMADLLDELPEPWTGTSRVTVLLMGLDYRDWESGGGAPRTDSMMLATLDPISETAGMLSIPRDLWVEIPAYGHGRINTAYALGEQDRLPGGGPALAVKTIEKLLGVPIQYYIQIDFGAFVRMVDEIGGVEIDVPERIKVDPIAQIGPDNTVTLEPGVQILCGELALAYARARHTEGGDFDRARRQQQVAMAIRDKVLNPGMIPILFGKVSVLYQELASGIRTNLSLDQMVSLGLLALQISNDDIRRAVIGPPLMVTLETVYYGGKEAQVLKPVPSQIRILRDEIFTATGAIGPSISYDDEATAAEEENARLAVLNGAGEEGLAGRTAELLRELGFNVTQVSNADRMDYPTTRVVDYTGNPYTTQYLMVLMDLTQSQILFQSIPEAEVDVALIVGYDWPGILPKLSTGQD